MAGEKKKDKKEGNPNCPLLFLPKINIANIFMGWWDSTPQLFIPPDMR